MNTSEKGSDKEKRRKVDGKKIAEQKRQKFLLKQQKKMEQQQSKTEDDEWFKRYGTCITRIDVMDAKNFKKFSARKNGMRSRASTTCTCIDSRKRPRTAEAGLSSGHDDDTTMDLELEMDPNLLSKLEYIQPYMDLKDANETSSVLTNSEEIHASNGTRYFIAEGTETVRMLLEQSAVDTNDADTSSSERDGDNSNRKRIKIHSILTKPSPFLEEPVNLRKTLCESYQSVFDKRGDSNNSDASSTLPFQVIVGSEKAMTEIVGFPVARGAMACGIVPHYDEQWLMNHLRTKQKQQLHVDSDSSIRILALENICDTANLGSLIRTSAAFGIHVVILSDDSCDAWYRRCVRVSMGHVLTVPSVRVANLSFTLNAMRREFNIKSYAAVINHDADTVLEQTEKGGISMNWCCVLGNEGNGLTEQMARSCDHTIRIQMDGIIDSLSVGVAGGILLHGMKEREAKSISH